MTEATQDRSADYKEAAVELGKGIALGLVPFLGQAIDAYDTIESTIVLYNAKKEEDIDSARFDLLLAIVGWIPGPGDGVKKSLRIVNKDPQRFAPVLFELLRFVLKECGIDASPEALLDEVFNATKLKAVLAEVQKGVEDATAFKQLPDWMQSAVKTTLSQAVMTMPLMVGVVEKRLAKWKKLQPNSSARAMPQGRATKPPPEARDANVARQGQHAPTHGNANDSITAEIATQSLSELTHEMVGISGEHIADYICAQTFGWGKDWQGHDAGAEGRWSQGTPSKDKLGKLSKGGSPKAAHVLYRLSDGANGTGIDAVWRAEGHNSGKKYAVVEAKASRNEDAPKFMRKLNNTRKPNIKATLGAVAKGELPIKDLVEVIEPIEEDAQSGGGKPPASGKPSSRSKKVSDTAKPKTSSQGASRNDATQVLVQMSHEWIRENIQKAVSSDIALEFMEAGKSVYSRHLFYAPAYHLSGSPKAHMVAKAKCAPANDHPAHDAFHFDDGEVKKAVNARKAALRKKHGDLPSLKEEK
jgi:hypothetical protein